MSCHTQWKRCIWCTSLKRSSSTFWQIHVSVSLAVRRKDWYTLMTVQQIWICRQQQVSKYQAVKASSSFFWRDVCEQGDYNFLFGELTSRTLCKVHVWSHTPGKGIDLHIGFFFFLEYKNEVNYLSLTVRVDVLKKRTACFLVSMLSSKANNTTKETLKPADKYAW